MKPYQTLLSEIPKWIMDCPISANWVEYKGETFFAMLNYKRSIKAGRPMIDLFPLRNGGTELQRPENSPVLENKFQEIKARRMKPHHIH